MYNVHMKRVTASEARRNWFQLLDQVAAGEIIMIERNGVRVLLQREARAREVPDYGHLLSAGEVARADEWGWEWSEESELTPTSPPRSRS